MLPPLRHAIVCKPKWIGESPWLFLDHVALRACRSQMDRHDCRVFDQSVAFKSGGQGLNMARHIQAQAAEVVLQKHPRHLAEKLDTGPPSLVEP